MVTVWNSATTWMQTFPGTLFHHADSAFLVDLAFPLFACFLQAVSTVGDALYTLLQYVALSEGR
jgi:hypothetical protein